MPQVTYASVPGVKAIVPIPHKRVSVRGTI